MDFDFSYFPVLETRRLTMKQLTPEFANEILAMRSNQRISEFIFRPPMQSADEALELIKKVENTFSNKQGIAWTGFLKEEKTIIGTCGFNSIDHPNNHAEIGGEMAVEYWGRRLPQEALFAVLNFGFTKMNLHTIEAKILPGNRSTVFWLEKFGFVREALYRDRIFHNNSYHDMAVYTLHKTSFQPI
ncbi:MAG: GNAT family N-acetyltransferase [Bacteroidetes bacterium]|nr:GNAT family N-acetyltransferase [Bacteroidota bacterium]